MRKRPATLDRVTRERAIPPGWNEPREMWVAMDTAGRRFLAPSESEARRLLTDYNTVKGKS
jgi:hypothetical protein